MAAPTNYDQTNEWLAEVDRRVGELIGILKAGVNVSQSGTLGNLSLFNTLAEAPIGSASNFRSRIQENVTITDWNSTPNTNCFLAAAGASAQNKPPGGSTNGWQLSVSDGSYKKQYASGINYRELYVRVYDNGAWTDWDEFVLTSKSGVQSQTASMGNSPGRLADQLSGFRHISSSDIPTDIPKNSDFTWASVIALPRTTSRTGGAILQTLGNDLYTIRFVSGNATVNKLYSDRNTTRDSNGTLRAASPIFRVATTAPSAAGDGFADAGAGKANDEAQGVTAERAETGVYVVTGSLGFAKDNVWPNGFVIPQDANGNNLVFAEAEEAENGTITVRTFEPAFDWRTGRHIGGDPMDIPDNRWIDLRLSMPEPELPDQPEPEPEQTNPTDAA